MQGARRKERRLSEKEEEDVKIPKSLLNEWISRLKSIEEKLRRG